MSGAVPERQTSALGPSTNPTPVDELVERLRRSVTDTTAFCPKPVYRNPDGPEAADQLTIYARRVAELEAEVERLQQAPTEADRSYASMRAALTGEQAKQPEREDDIDGFVRMHFENCDYFTSRGSKPCTMDCCS